MIEAYKLITRGEFIMKKVWSYLICVTLVIALSSPVKTIAATATADNVSYNGKTYKTSELSQDTINWLEWYNSLSDDLKEMVSHEPAELSSANVELSINEPSFDNSFKLSESKLLDDSSVDFLSAQIMSLPSDLPVVYPYAPVYNPNYWNSSNNIKHANCYAYCLNYRTPEEGKLQPGDLSGARYSSLTKTAIVKAAKADGPVIKRTITDSTKAAKPGKNQYKIALVIAPNTDYHWYIQNRDGYWSHKRGLEEISNLDASGKKITDPQTCNRNYGNNLNYSVFCGYYLVKY